MKKNIKFFLFAPAITLFSTGAGSCNYIPTDVTIVYENGAKINTSFVTNLGGAKIDNAPSLYSSIVQVVKGSSLEKMLPKYSYPNVVVTATKFNAVTRKGVRIKIKNGHFIRSLKSQSENKKTIFGSGFLISEDDAARIEAARIEAIEPVVVWTLSEEEQKIVASLAE